MIIIFLRQHKHIRNLHTLHIVMFTRSSMMVFLIWKDLKRQDCLYCWISEVAAVETVAKYCQQVKRTSVKGKWEISSRSSLITSFIKLYVELISRHLVTITLVFISRYIARFCDINLENAILFNIKSWGRQLIFRVCHLQLDKKSQVSPET